MGRWSLGSFQHATVTGGGLRDCHKTVYRFVGFTNRHQFPIQMAVSLLLFQEISFEGYAGKRLVHQPISGEDVSVHLTTSLPSFVYLAHSLSASLSASLSHKVRTPISCLNVSERLDAVLITN